MDDPTTLARQLVEAGAIRWEAGMLAVERRDRMDSLAVSIRIWLASGEAPRE